jgi:hypothetical protein
VLSWPLGVEVEAVARQRHFSGCARLPGSHFSAQPSNRQEPMRCPRTVLSRSAMSKPIPPSLSVTLPLFRDAADESREELQELWARLLAAAMDPSRADRVRARFFDALQKLDPLDARVLACLHGRGGGAYEGQRNEMAGELGISRDEVEVSLANLRRVELAFEPQGNLIAITALGREFLRAVAD